MYEQNCIDKGIGRKTHSRVVQTKHIDFCRFLHLDLGRQHALADRKLYAGLQFLPVLVVPLKYALGFSPAGKRCRAAILSSLLFSPVQDVRQEVKGGEERGGNMHIEVVYVLV